MNIIASDNTAKTPRIEFNPNTGEFIIEGRSISENAFAFFKPFIEWIDKYLLQPAPKTIFTLRLEYFNSSSLKSIMIILKKLETLYNNGHDAAIHWYYESDDEDMQAEGKNCATLLRIPFSVIQISEH